jgi:transmembrane sensor
MDKGLPSQSDEDRIDLEAAEWLIIKDQGFTPAQQDAFLQWLVSDPCHGERYAQHQQTWRELDVLVQWRPEHSAEPNPDLLVKSRTVVRWRSWAAAVGLAAAVALLIGSWSTLHTLPTTTNTAQTTVIVAHMQESRVLEDGTVVQLNRGSMIGVKYLPRERSVHLMNGEAQFKVAKNPARPFFVSAGGVQVRAVGTAFNVKLGSALVEVLVTEGKVRVNLPQPDDAEGMRSVMVEAGQKTVVDLSQMAPAPLVEQATVPEVDQLRAWQPELLDFDSTPLSNVVEKFNEANGVQLGIADPELGRMPIVASFRSDNVKAFVHLLEMTPGIRVERRSDIIILRKAD